MYDFNGHGRRIFRAFGEAVAIVWLSYGVYLGLLFKMKPSNPIADMFCCGSPLLAFAWYAIRVDILTTAAKSDKSPRGESLGFMSGYKLKKRADLNRIATPATKQKKRKNHAASSDLAHMIQGRGTQATDPVDLEAGLYRLAYQFKRDVSTTIKLIQCLSGEENVLLMGVSGTGSQTFTVTEADHYLFQVVVPGAQFPAWKIEVERL